MFLFVSHNISNIILTELCLEYMVLKCTIEMHDVVLEIKINYTCSLNGY